MKDVIVFSFNFFRGDGGGGVELRSKLIMKNLIRYMMFILYRGYGLDFKKIFRIGEWS